MQSGAKHKSLVIALAFIFSLFSIAFFSRTAFSLPLLSILILLFLAAKGTVIMWTISVGLMLEVVSPYPDFTYLFAFFITVVILRICMHYYLSHRTLLSAAVAGALGSFVFALSIAGFSRLGAAFGDGWMPAFDYSFVLTMAAHAGILALALVVVLSIFWRFSPKLRGVVISRSV